MHNAARLFVFISALLCAALLTRPSSIVAAQEVTQRYGNPNFKFELEYPSLFVPRDSGNPQAPLFLLPRGASYPSFNVVVEPQALMSSEFTLDGQGERVLAAYRRLGLTDAQLIDKRSVRVGGKPAYSFVIRFGSNDQITLAAVTIVPRAKFLYTLTFMDSSAGFESSRALLKTIVDSFRSSDAELGAAATASDTYGYSLFLLCLAFLMALAFLMRRRKRPS